MSAPRVLVVGTLFAQGLGGVQRHQRELLPRVARELRSRGGNLSVLLGREGLDFELAGDIERIASDIPAHPVAARFLRESERIAELRDFDLIHTGHLPLPLGLERPCTLTLHDLKSVAGAASTRSRAVLGAPVIRDSVARARKVLCVSKTLAREVRELTGCAPERLAVVPNGCDHLELRERAPARESFLLCVGRLEPRKNVETLLRALALDRDLPPVVLAGSSQGEHEAKLRELAKELNVEARVKFAGALTDSALAEAYASCVAVVLPSRREGFDLPLAEALRAGAPVAASALEVHRELAGDAATYFDPEDPLALAKAVHEARAPEVAPSLPTWDAAARACVAEGT
ncbi:MAG: glycosyltransferase family 1 protein, partial [Planctomycetota bacterium]|nr:glycosyltransferase family 1 protein [Planctomycetota bacterium]